MKKKLVVLLAVVMMFAFSASAYAATFSDVSERPVVEQDAIKKAVALGIIEGYEDGTFGPDKTITRAEFAKIAVTAAGAKDTATMLEANASNFKDVKANSWYTGWINASESLGIFKGDTNGNFRPNDTISNQEAITVLLRLLGYNDNLTGSWPVNYVTKANQINILDDVNIVASAAAKRGDITVMLSATLDSDLVTYDKDTNEFVKKQVGITSSDFVTLLSDSFEGSYIEVSKFEQITQLRDVAGKTLNWGVGQVSEKVSTTVNGVTSTYEKPANYKGTLIVDKDTAVSYNAAGLFDLENHQGKVYYVKGNDGKMYARFIEVESYTQTVTDEPKKATTGNRVTVNTTNYNATSNVNLDNAGSKKNTNYTMYFNDDDQVYLAVTDQFFTERTFYVKSTTNTSARLVGDFAKDKDTEVRGSKTVNMSDADTLIWDGDKFISPSELEVGDALREIVEGDLYVKIADANGTFTRFTEGDGKVTIDGKNYVIPGVAKSGSKADVPFYDEELETSDATLDDVYSNNVRYVLNKNNTVAAIIVDETSTGTTLYGIVVGGDNNSQYWGSGSSNSITLFNQEGYNVTYDFKKDCNYGVMDSEGKRYTDKVKPNPEQWMGRLVEFKLNSNGEIKEITLIAEETATKNTLAFDATKEIEVKNNAYLVDSNGKSYTLASNVVIFEVGQDEEDFDPSLVTRSNLLSSGDFTPATLKDVVLNGNKPATDLDAYAVFNTNTSGAIKVLAYTTANTSNYHFGVVKAYGFRDSDHTYAITLEGDDTVYDLFDGTGKVDSKANAFIVYTLSGDEIKVVYSYEHKDKLEDYTKAVNGFNSGLISLKDAFTGVAKKSTNAGKAGYVEDNRLEVGETSEVYNIMTDANTVVYIIDATSGKYVEGSLDDISRNSHVAVPVIDKDGYADVVLVDEYTRYGADNSDDSSDSSVKFNTPTLEVLDKDGNKIDGGHGIVFDSSVKSSSVEIELIIPDSFGKYGVEIFANGTKINPTKNGNTYTIKASDFSAGTVDVKVTVTER